MKNSPIRYWYVALVVFIPVVSSTIAATSLMVAKEQRVKPLTSFELDDIREAVFRYQFQHNASAQQQNANAYFLSLEDGQDPGDRFLRRFKDHQPPVKKGSEIKDRAGGLKGLMFRIDAIKRITPNKVEVEGGYYEGTLSSSGNTYTVLRIKKKWIVTQHKLRWIS